MNDVHPTAVIGEHVTMGTGNTVGPFAVIGGVVDLGDDNWIGAGAKIGCPPEVRSYPHIPGWIDSDAGQGVIVGSHTVLRENVQIHGGWHARTILGDNLFIMNQAYVAHDCVVEDDVTLASGVVIGGHAVIGRGANLGLNVAVHQRRVVGALAMVGMSSVVTRDIPPFLKAYGNPCRTEGVNVTGLERSGVSAQSVRRIVDLAAGRGFPRSASSVDEVGAHVARYLEAIE